MNIILSARWQLSDGDLDAIRTYRPSQQKTVEISRGDLVLHLGEDVAGYIMEAVNTLAELELPDKLLLVLVLVTVFTRDGLFMDKQVNHSK